MSRLFENEADESIELMGGQAVHPVKKSTRRRIVEAGRKICAQGGYMTCSVVDITSLAEVTRSSFYFYFKGKDDLLTAILEDQLEAYVRQYNTIDAARASSVQGLVKWFNQFVDIFRNAGDLMALYWVNQSKSEVIKQHRLNRQKAIEVLGHRLPYLGIFACDGSINSEQLVEINLFILQMEQACYEIAKLEDSVYNQAMLQRLAVRFIDLAVRAGGIQSPDLEEWTAI